MRKILISGLVIIALGVAGCGAAPTSAPTEQTQGVSWEEVEKEIFRGDLGYMETVDRINKSKFDYDTKEDIKAVVYQIMVYDERVTGIKEEAQKMWEMRAERPDTWIYDYQVEQEKNK